MTAAGGARRRGLRRLGPEPAIALGAGALIAALSLVPLGYLVRRAFFAGGEPTLAILRDAYRAYGLGEMAWTSLVFAAGATAAAVVPGTALAYLIVRTDLPARRALFVVALTPLLLPGVLYTIAWIFLASPRSGILNTLLEPVLGPRALDVFGLGGMIAVEALHLTPLAFLLMAAGFRFLDPALEEAALASGAHPLEAFRRVTLPLVRPALSATALIVAIRSLEAFEAPALLGIPRGVWVFTSRIWRSLGEIPPDLGAASAYALPLVALTAAGLLLHLRLWRRRQELVTVTGRGHRPSRVPLGRWRWPTTLVVVCYFAVSALLPVLALVYVSTQRLFTPVTWESLGSATLDSYGRVLRDDLARRAVENSLLLAVFAATAVVLLAAAASWIVVRSRLPGRRLLDLAAFLPIAVPGLVLAIGLLAFALRSPVPLYGTAWILLLAYVTRFLPYGMRYLSISMTQVAGELEDSARASGAGWWQTFRRVLLPLLAPGLVAAWLYVLVVATRELSASIVLYSPGNEVLSVAIWDYYTSGRFPELAALGVLMVLGLCGLALLGRLVAGRLLGAGWARAASSPATARAEG